MPEPTLPDYLQPDLDLVFVGINPGLQSAQAGHYFHTPANRFWPAVSRAGIFDPTLDRETDYKCLEQGIGFTDLVKRASSSASQIRAGEFREGAAALKERMTAAAPKVVCFNGVTSYRNYLKYAEGDNRSVEPGLQPEKHYGATIFVAPSPSPANAGVSLDELVDWYARLADLLRTVRSAG